MPIFAEQLEFRAKGSLNQTEDWWTLCYDSDAKEFYIEHQWDHMDPYNIGKKPTNAGKSRISMENYIGVGAEKIAEAKRILIERASA